MAGYVSNLKKDIARWEADGLIDASTAAKLRKDADSRPGGVSFGLILSMLAAVLIGASILLLVAANWEYIPRLVRVGLIFALIAGGYVGGAILKGRGNTSFAEAAYILGAVAFGAGIALIAQMYHLSGEETQAIFLWCGGTALAALALRSGPLTAGAVLLATIWMNMVTFDTDWFGAPPMLFLGVVAVIWAISLWSQSAVARHLILLALMYFAVLHYVDTELVTVPLILAVASVALFGAWVLAPDLVDRIIKLGDHGAPIQGLLGFIAGMSPIQYMFQNDRLFLLIVVVIFAAVIAALVLGGRESRMLRWLGYAAFTYEVIYVYVVLVVSMIGTAGFFLSAGLVVAGLAWAITRIERRLKAPPAEATGGAT
ncbi:MAG: DUF2157 domain-containing protein [Rhizobiaceae bacterium]|nr:DUF2157 domain-containing protein [Rhizobiaceae bacterium]